MLKGILKICMLQLSNLVLPYCVYAEKRGSVETAQASCAGSTWSSLVALAICTISIKSNSCDLVNYTLYIFGILHLYSITCISTLSSPASCAVFSLYVMYVHRRCNMRALYLHCII